MHSYSQTSRLNTPADILLRCIATHRVLHKAKEEARKIRTITLLKVSSKPRGRNKNVDKKLPFGHTCGNSMDAPQYSSAEIMKNSCLWPSISATLLMMMALLVVITRRDTRGVSKSTKKIMMKASSSSGPTKRTSSQATERNRAIKRWLGSLLTKKMTYCKHA